MTAKILIVDDQQLVRTGLRSLLDSHRDIKVIAEADSGRMAVDAAKKYHPDIILMDISMPDLNGFEATQKILSDSPDIKIIALSVHSDKPYIVKMLKAGVSGYLLKDCAFEELTEAIRSVSEDKFYLSPGIAGTIVDDFIFHTSKKSKGLSFMLTAREREVLQLIAEGLSTKEISSRLSISVKTSESHRRQIMSKLNIRSIARLTKFALREGLTEL